MPAQPPVVRVALVEDQPLFRETLKHALNSVPGLHARAAASVAEASSWDAREFDVALLDFELPDGNGLGLGRDMQRAHPGIGIVLLSAVDRVLALLELDERERWSYLSKNSATSVLDLVRAIRAAAEGRIVIDPQILASRQPRAGSRLDALSPRQYQVLTLIAEGFTNAAIAEHLELAVNSVNNHVNAVYATLGLTDAARNPRVSAVRILLQDSV